MNYNKNVIHDIIHSSVDTIKEMEQDSKDFRESVKNNTPLTNSKTLPTSTPTTNAEPSAYSIEQIQFYLSNLTQHLTMAYKGSRYSAKRYNLVRSDGSIQLANVTLDALREYLLSENY